MRSCFQSVCEASSHLLSKLDIITTPPRNHFTSVIIILCWLPGTVAPGCHVMSALMCDFVQDSGSADGVNNRCLSSGCKKMGNESLELPSEVSNEGNLYRSLVQLGLSAKKWLALPKNQGRCTERTQRSPPRTQFPGFRRFLRCDPTDSTPGRGYLQLHLKPVFSRLKVKIK